jgi:hypothetical protein
MYVRGMGRGFESDECVRWPDLSHIMIDLPHEERNGKLFYAEARVGNLEGVSARFQTSSKAFFDWAHFMFAANGCYIDRSLRASKSGEGCLHGEAICQ